MTQERRKLLAVAVIATALLAFAGWSLLSWSDSADLADRLAADTLTARRLARRIEDDRPANMQRAAGETLSAQLPQRLDSALKAAEIDAENLDRISPQPPRHFGQGDFSEMPLQLVFHQTSLRQLLQFVTVLTRDNPWLAVREIHFSASASSETVAAGSDWDIDLTVSYLTISTAGGVAAGN